MIHVRRFKRRRKVVVTITWPENLVQSLVTAGLLVASVVGLGYTLGPAMLHSPQPVSNQAMAKPEPVKKPPSLSRSEPVSLEAPDINLSTDLITLGKNNDGTLQVPDSYEVAGWYKYSPTPGEIGPAVIAGHVDNYLGAAVFFYLKDLQPGQPIYVTRADGSRVRFTVDRVELVDQQNFPTQQVYGNIDYAGLRLITCGGDFDPLTGHYLGNTIVYATYAPDAKS